MHLIPNKQTNVLNCLYKPQKMQNIPINRNCQILATWNHILLIIKRICPLQNFKEVTYWAVWNSKLTLLLCLRFCFYVVRATKPGAVQVYTDCEGKATQYTVKSFVTWMGWNFNLKIILHLLRYPWKNFYNRSATSTIWFLKIYSRHQAGYLI